MAGETQTTSPTPASTPAATPAASAPASVSTGTTTGSSGPSNTGDARTQVQAAPSEETFTNVDVNSLSPELREKYNSMLTDYKKKTSEIARLRKDSESALEKARYYDQIAADETFVSAWNEYIKNQQSNGQQGDGQIDPMTKLQQDLMKERQERITESAGRFVQEFKSRPEYQNFSKYDKKGLITGYVQLYPPKSASQKDWEKTLRDAYSYAEGVFNEAYEEGKQWSLSRANEKISQSTETPSGAPQEVYSGPDPLTLTARQAVELARRGIRVPRKN